ncbi:MAG: hypothetical protein Ct9H300mP25_01370 [Acidobacteriota bacterium]|nr:MAG: hypothetical protein Ct9H300mP25_01370 [Acidobacteriota bacterium]
MEHDLYERPWGGCHRLKFPSRLRPPIVYESHGYAPVFAETLAELVPGKESVGSRKLRRLEKRERHVWQCADGYVATTQVLLMN